MKKMKIFVICMLFSPSLLAAKVIHICTDSSLWYPFTFTKHGEAAGLHVDVVKAALSHLGYQVIFHPLPWKRCLIQAQDGIVDAIVSASYNKVRAHYLFYPPDAASHKKSAYRIQQVEYVVVTSAGNPYDFKGDVTTLPQPVLAPSGYSIADDLKKQGVIVDDAAAGDENNMYKLIRTGRGSMVTIPEVVQLLSLRPQFKGKLKIDPIPVKSKSYFLPFSKKTSLTAEERMRIWKEIAQVRESKLFSKLASQY